MADTLARKPDVLLAALASSTVMLHPDTDGPSGVFSFALPPLEALAVFEKEREGKRETRNRLSAEVRKIARAKKDAVREAAALSSSHDLSPGEARKLMFALAMLDEVSVIALDEPTNHMDAVSAMSLAGSAGIYRHRAYFCARYCVHGKNRGNFLTS